MADSSVTVEVDGVVITAREIAKRADFARLVYPKHAVASLTEIAQEELIEEVLISNESIRRGVRVPDKEIALAIVDLAKSMGTSSDVLLARFDYMGVSDTFKSRVKHQILWNQLVSQRFRGEVVISDAEIEQALEKQFAAGAGYGKDAIAEGQTEEYTLYEISMLMNEQTKTLRMAEAERLRKKVSSCSSLVSDTFDLNDTVVRLLGKSTTENLPDHLRDVLKTTAVGRLSKPIDNGSFLLMFAVCGKRAVRGDLSISKKTESDLRVKGVVRLANLYKVELRRRAIIVYK